MFLSSSIPITTTRHHTTTTHSLSSSSDIILTAYEKNHQSLDTISQQLYQQQSKPPANLPVKQQKLDSRKPSKTFDSLVSPHHLYIPTYMLSKTHFIHQVSYYHARKISSLTPRPYFH